MHRALVDTDILSDLLRGKNAQVEHHAAVCLAEHQRLSLSASTVFEIVRGRHQAGHGRGSTLPLFWWTPDSVARQRWRARGAKELKKLDATASVRWEKTTGTPTRLRPPPAAVSGDANNDWSAAGQGEEVDCHRYTRAVYDYLLLTHGRDSYDHARAEMHMYAELGNNGNNASWNGAYVKIGDGDSIDWDPLGSLDMIAHEWAHAVSET